MNMVYRQLIQRIEELAARLSSYYSKHLVCRAGCSSCCHHHLTVFRVEADAIREAIQALPEETRSLVEQRAREVNEREELGLPLACPLLIDDRCAIYSSRPVICRTQGLPLLFESDDGEEEVDFCPLNFSTPGAVNDLDEEHLVPLEDVNLKLATVNLQYCIEEGVDKAASGQRIKMSEVILRRPD